MSLADVHRPPSLQLDSARRRPDSTSPSSPFPLSSSVFESDSDFRSQSSASLIGSSPPDLHSGLLSLADSNTSTVSTPTKKRTSSQPAASLAATPLRQTRHSLSSSSTLSLPSSSPRKHPISPPDEPIIYIPSPRSSSSSLKMQLAAIAASSSSLALGGDETDGRILKVRDFAYEESDERHHGKGLEGQGQPQPAPAKEAFQSGWGFGQPMDQDSELDHGPFGPYDENEHDLSGGDFAPGWYRCLYDFVPEGPAEMAMTAGDVYHLVSRCGPVGWVIAVNEDGTSGIVPEGYVTIERYDWEIDEERTAREANDDELEVDRSLEHPSTVGGQNPDPGDEESLPTPHANDEPLPAPHENDEPPRTSTPPPHETDKPDLSPTSSLRDSEDSLEPSSVSTPPLNGSAAPLTSEEVEKE